MKIDPFTVSKKKIIRRITNHSCLYVKDELEIKSLEELTKIQDIALIKLILKVNFKNRRLKIKHQTY